MAGDPPSSRNSNSPLIPPPLLGQQPGGSSTDHNYGTSQASMSDSRDFSDAPKELPTVTFDLGGDMEAGLSQTPSPEALRPPAPPRAHSVFSESGVSIHNPPPESLDPHNPNSDPHDPIIRNRRSRANTMWQTFPSIVDNPRRVAWEPGQEPGLDPEKVDGGRPRGMASLQQECDITIVDYSEGNMVMRNLTNQNLPRWIEKEQLREEKKRLRQEEEANEKAGKSRREKRKMNDENEQDDRDWVKCRWINVNGLSWDVIQEIAKYKKLHRLALEDLVNTKNRTKADWYVDPIYTISGSFRRASSPKAILMHIRYSDQTYIILTLQKLVQIPPEDSDSEDDLDSDNEDEESSLKTLRGSIKKSAPMHILDKILSRDQPQGTSGSTRSPVPDPSRERGGSSATLVNSASPDRRTVNLPLPRTLQRYNGGPNLERMVYMENNSALTEKSMAVCAEQVSIFLLGDNTVVSFFESSGEDIEAPILRRLATPETILRRSCDASMLVQAIIDAIIDMAIPVATTYSEIIQELELEVLTEPSIHHTRELYILTSEVTTMRNFISPIATLVRTMRDHKGQVLAAINRDIHNAGIAHHVPHANVEISPLTAMYLADVEDHTLSILSDLEQISNSAAGLISLIFNTISALQNESMKQLTTATIIFLPMTFITGYFGMNFQNLSGITPGTGRYTGTDKYFWVIAAPVAFVTLVALMWGGILRWIMKWFNKAKRKRQQKFGGDRLFGNRSGRLKRKKTV